MKKAHFFTFALTLLSATLTFNSYAQTNTMTPENSSIALKPIHALDNIPVVHENEVRGGWHQIDGLPWEGDEKITADRLEKGMIVTNKNTLKEYRYIGTAPYNTKNDWQEIFIVSNFDPNKSYKAGRCVVASAYYTTGENAGTIGPNTEERRIYQAKEDVAPNSGEPKEKNNLWECLHQGLVIKDDQKSTTKTIVSAGRTIVFVDADTDLSTDYPATNRIGQILIFKYLGNKTNGITISGNINGEDNQSIHLFSSGKYVKLLSDGTTWHEIETNNLRQFTLYSPETKPDSDPSKVIDAIYFGDPNTLGSIRMYAYIENYNIEWESWQEATEESGRIWNIFYAYLEKKYENKPERITKYKNYPLKLYILNNSAFNKIENVNSVTKSDYRIEAYKEEDPEDDERSIIKHWKCIPIANTSTLDIDAKVVIEILDKDNNDEKFWRLHRNADSPTNPIGLYKFKENQAFYYSTNN